MASRVRNLFDTFGETSDRHYSRTNAQERLITAVEHGDVHSAGSLLRKGISPNFICRGDSWLIHSAVDRCYLGVVYELLAAGANINVRNAYGQTPLLMACRQRSFALVSLLLRYCADPSVRDHASRVPLDFVNFRPMGAVLERCIRLCSHCPRIPLSSDFHTIVRRRALTAPPPSPDIRLDVNSKRDMERLYMCYLSVMSLGGYHKVCHRDEWDLVHSDSTGSRLDLREDAVEQRLYRQYILLVEDDLYDSCPPSPRAYLDHAAAASSRGRYESEHRRSDPRSTPVPAAVQPTQQSSHRSPHASHGLLDRPSATHGEPSNVGEARRTSDARLPDPREHDGRLRHHHHHHHQQHQQHHHQEQQQQHQHQEQQQHHHQEQHQQQQQQQHHQQQHPHHPQQQQHERSRGTAATYPTQVGHVHRDPRLVRKREQPSPPVPLPIPDLLKPIAQDSTSDSCWSTTPSRNSGSSWLDSGPAPDVKRSVFESLKLLRSPSDPRLKGLSSERKDREDRTPSHPPTRKLPHANGDRKETRTPGWESRRQTSPSRHECTPSIAANHHSSSPVKLKQSPAVVAAAPETASPVRTDNGVSTRRKVAAAKPSSTQEPRTPAPFASSCVKRDLSRHSMPVLERMKAAFLQEDPCPVVPAPADSTTSDLSPTATTVSPVVTSSPKSQPAVTYSSHIGSGSSNTDTASSPGTPLKRIRPLSDSRTQLAVTSIEEHAGCKSDHQGDQDEYTKEEEEDRLVVDLESQPTTPDHDDSGDIVEVSDGEQCVASTGSRQHSPSSVCSSNLLMFDDDDDDAEIVSALDHAASACADEDYDNDRCSETSEADSTKTVGGSSSAGASKRRARELERLVITPPPCRSPPKEVAVPDFVTDPRYLSREQRKLQQTLQHFQLMEMRASAKANRQKRKTNNAAHTEKPKTNTGTSSSSVGNVSQDLRKVKQDKLPKSQLRAAGAGLRCNVPSRAQLDQPAPAGEARAARALSPSSQPPPKVRKVQHVKPFVQGEEVPDNMSQCSESSQSSHCSQSSQYSDSMKGGKKFQDFRPTILPTRSRATTAAATAASVPLPSGTAGKRSRETSQSDTRSRSASPAGSDYGNHEPSAKRPAMKLATAAATGKQKKKVMEGVAKDTWGETPVHRAARNGDLPRIKQCIDQGMDVNCQDNAGWTPLHEAISRNRIDVAEILLQNGATPDPIAGDGTTPLDDAMERNSLEAVQLLLRFGADPTRALNATNFTVDEESESAIVFKEALSVRKSTVFELGRALPKPLALSDRSPLPTLDDMKPFEAALRADIHALVQHLGKMSADKPSYYAGAAFEVSDEPFLPTYSLAVMPGSSQRYNYVLVEDVLETLNFEASDFLTTFPSIQELNITMASFCRLAEGSLFNPCEPLDRVTDSQRAPDEEISLFLWNDDIRTVLGIPLVLL
ncbi:uncharacterized protein LOC135810074 isoform X2 [Sycon ciliatum]|uniref:uncharacterized protein LOC135810074 isoform X2 n=1 Tax=Sycon ciliatum TaxID=27933 RepID=UPI0031F6DB22